jgi:hypothetical protein
MRRKHERIAPLDSALSLAAAVVAITLLAPEANALDAEDDLPLLSTVVEPLTPGVTENQVLAELAAHNDQRRTALYENSVLRTYQIIDLKGKVHAKKIGRMEFLSPDKKTFTVTSESGSGLVRTMALNPPKSSPRTRPAMITST